MRSELRSASRSRCPRPASCRTANAVTGLLKEPARNTVPALTGRLSALEATPQTWTTGSLEASLQIGERKPRDTALAHQLADIGKTGYGHHANLGTALRPPG